MLRSSAASYAGGLPDRFWVFGRVRGGGGFPL